MTIRKLFYGLIGLQIIILAVLVVVALRGTDSISLCRYDLLHPFGYITPADVAMLKMLHGGTESTKCPRGVFTAVYFLIYTLLLTTVVYILILMKKLFSKPADMMEPGKKEDQS